jgi:hypothetical protein
MQRLTLTWTGLCCVVLPAVLPLSRVPHIKVGQSYLLCKCLQEFMADCRAHGELQLPQDNLGKTALQAGKEIPPTAAAAAAADGLPVIICGDFNSLWKKYRPDFFDPWVSCSAWSIRPGEPLLLLLLLLLLQCMVACHSGCYNQVNGVLSLWITTFWGRWH